MMSALRPVQLERRSLSQCRKTNSRANSQTPNPHATATSPPQVVPHRQHCPIAARRRAQKPHRRQEPFPLRRLKWPHHARRHPPTRSWSRETSNFLRAEPVNDAGHLAHNWGRCRRPAGSEYFPFIASFVRFETVRPSARLVARPAS